MYGLRGEVARKNEMVSAKIKKNWQDKKIPERIAKCVLSAKKICPVTFLPDGIEMFFKHSTIFADILFQANIFYAENNEDFQWEVSEFLDEILWNFSGDYIVHFCENTNHDKKNRDELMRFSVALELLLRKDKIVQDMLYTVIEILSIVPKVDPNDIQLLMKRTMLMYFLVETDDSLLEAVFDELEKLGFHETRDGFGVIKKSLILFLNEEKR